MQRTSSPACTRPRSASTRAVEPRPSRLSKRPREAPDAHAGPEGVAGDPSAGHLEHDAPSDVHAIADARSTRLEAGDREILTEGRRLERAAEMLLPPGVVALAVDVDGLIGPAVMLLGRDQVAREAEGADLDGAGHRLLADAAADRAATAAQLGRPGRDVDAAE